MTWIIRDPGILVGTPCIRGTRVPVDCITQLLDGTDPCSIEEVHEYYPHVPLEAITWLRHHPEEWTHE